MENFKIEIKNDKYYNLKDIYNILEYNYEYTNIIYCTIDQLKKYFNNNDKEIKLVNYLQLYTKKLNILSYILVNNKTYIIENPIFKDIWVALYYKKNIVITENIMKFLYKFDKFNKSKIIKYKFLEFLKYNNINFELIDYKNPKIKNYKRILQDIKKLSTRTIQLKTWIILTTDDFKEVCMIKSNIIRKLYMEIEKLLLSYIEYEKNLETIKVLNYKNQINYIKENVNKLINTTSTTYIY